MRLLILFFFVSVTAYAQPEWTQDLNRRVIGGHILYVGKGTAVSSDLAMFKAEQAAYAGIINECNGRAPAEMRIAERHEADVEDGVYTAFARAAVTFSECDEAKFGRTKENAALKEAQEFHKALLVVDGQPELLKKVNWRETETMVLKFKKDMEWEMKTYKEELKKDAEVAYAKQQAEIDSLSEEVNAMKEEREWKRQEKQLMAKIAKQQEAEAKYSPEKKACWDRAKRMENQAMLNGTDFNEGLNEIHALAAKCERMK